MISCCMKLALVMALTLPQGATSQGYAVYSGFAAHYSRGMMQTVSRNRGLYADCMVASWKLPLGRWVTVLGQRTGVRRRCMVIDICAQRDCPRIRARGIVTELSYEDNKEICRRNGEPPRFCTVTVTEVTP